jgi:hypothetical protein
MGQGRNVRKGILKGGMRGVACRAPDDVQQRAVLAMVVKAVAGLHGAGLAHGALSPAAVLWFSRDNAMKLADLSCACAPGEPGRVPPSLRHAPPEVWGGLSIFNEGLRLQCCIAQRPSL